jgi:hypothetical protein
MKTPSVSYRFKVLHGLDLNDDVEALDKALDAYNAKTGYDIPIHVDAASGVSSFRSCIRKRNGTSV